MSSAFDLQAHFDGCESTVLEVQTNPTQKSLIIAAIYRHPHDNHDAFASYLKETLDKIASNSLVWRYKHQH